MVLFRSLENNADSTQTRPGTPTRNPGLELDRTKRQHTRLGARAGMTPDYLPIAHTYDRGILVGARKNVRER
jgi:hypothetical protein